MTSIEAPELRPVGERFITTSKGVGIGRSYVRQPRWYDAQWWEKCERRNEFWDRAVLLTSAIAAGFIVGLLVAERFA